MVTGSGLKTEPPAVEKKNGKCCPYNIIESVDSIIIESVDSISRDERDFH